MKQLQFTKMIKGGKEPLTKLELIKELVDDLIEASTDYTNALTDPFLKDREVERAGEAMNKAYDKLMTALERGLK